MSRKIQYSWIWEIKSEIKDLHTHICIESNKPTTQTCSCCWNKQKLWLWDRFFICEKCWVNIDRDINSSYNILQIWNNKKIPMEHRKFKSLEINTSMLLESISISKRLEMLDDICISVWLLKKETTCFSL